MGELVPMSAANVDTQCAGGKVLTFSVAGDVYAIGIQNIKEIIEYGSITRVPLVGRQIRGVLNLRGRIVPVIDLAERLSLPSERDGRRSCVVVLDVKNGEEVTELGILVNAVNQVLALEEGDVQAAPSFGTRIRDDFIVSMVRLAEGFVVILDHAAVLSIDELAEAVSCT